jgi:hypothetical protein
MVAERAGKGRSGLIALALLLVLGACASPADEPALRWVAFLDKHRALIANGKFDAEAFAKEGQPLVGELRALRSPKDHQVPLTSDVFVEWNRARDEFREAANKLEETSGDEAATTAFAALWKELAAGSDAPPANSQGQSSAGG